MSETIETPVAGSDFEVYVLQSSMRQDASLVRHAEVLHTPVAGFVDWPVNVLTAQLIHHEGAALVGNIAISLFGQAAQALGSETISGLVNAGLQISEDFPSFFVEAGLRAPLPGSETISGLTQGALARVDEHADTFHFEQNAVNASGLHADLLLA